MTQSPEEVTHRVYHYAQQRKNRETVYRQGTLINRNLKKMREMAQTQRAGDATVQYVTLPNITVEDTAKPLKEALEACSEVRSHNLEDAVEVPEQKKKKWYRWKH